MAPSHGEVPMVAMRDTRALNVALRTLRTSKSWQRAVHLLHSAVELRTRTSQVSYNTVMSCLQWQLATHFLQELQDVAMSPSTISYNTLTRALPWRMCCKLLSEMTVRMVRQDVKTWSFGSGNWNFQLRRVSEMKRDDIKLDVISYGIAMRGCADARAWHVGSSVLEAMPGCQIQPNGIIYGTFLNMVGKSTMWQVSLQGLDRMALSGLDWNKLCFHVTARACLATRWLQALGVLGSVHDVMDGVGYGTMIEATRFSGDTWQASVSCLQSSFLASLEVDVHMLSVSTSACEKESQWLSATQLLRSADVLMIQSDEVIRNAILSGYAKSSWRFALEAAVLMEQLAMKVDIFGFSALIGASKMDWYRSMFFLQRSGHESQVSEVCHNTFINACEMSGYAAVHGWQLATSLLHSLLACWMVPDLISCNSAISVCAESQEWQVAMQQFQCMTDWRIPQDELSFNSLAKSLEDSGQWELALALLALMLSTTYQLTPDEYSYSAAINACKSAVKLRHKSKSCCDPL